MLQPAQGCLEHAASAAFRLMVLRQMHPHRLRRPGFFIFSQSILTPAFIALREAFVVAAPGADDNY
jgi:hypothetical protein